MSVLEIFRSKKDKVVSTWIESVYNCYPLDTKGFLRTKKDDFCNPVGEITTTMGNYLFDAVAGEHVLEDKLTKALERFVKLRSVQDFTPSKGLGVLFVFKQIFRHTFLNDCIAKNVMADYLDAESRLDTLCLMALDLYVQSRESIAQQRITEIRKGHSQIVRYAQRHGLLTDELEKCVKD